MKPGCLNPHQVTGNSSRHHGEGQEEEGQGCECDKITVHVSIIYAWPAREAHLPCTTGNHLHAGEKPEKEKEKKDKPEKEKKDKADKPDKEKDKKDKKDKKPAEGSSASTARPPPQPKARGPPAPKAATGGYLDGMDLPSSSSDDEEYEKSARALEEKLTIVSVAGDSRKIADKERKLMEKAFQMKQEALREDDNVFDVAFEGQGDDNATTSATDVKVRSPCVHSCTVLAAIVSFDTLLPLSFPPHAPCAMHPCGRTSGMV